MTLNELSAADAARRLAAGTITAEQLLESCFARVSARETMVRAFAHVDATRAIVAARDLDRLPRKSTLHGVPVGVKDIIDTTDMPTEYGSPIFARHRPGADAACVKRLRELGCVIMGKTVTTEFAYYTPGPTANPLNPAHTPGGSSSGSAAAVADRMVPLAFGTQTAGSVIRPAAYCGVVGYKGTHGWFPLDGVSPLAPDLDTLGLYARSVEDIALFRGAMLGKDSTARAPARPRIALVKTIAWDSCERSTQDAITRAADCLARTADMREAKLPFDDAAIFEDQKLIMAAGTAAALGPRLAGHEQRLGRIGELIEQGRAIAPAALDAARGRVAEARTTLAAWFKDVDAILTPAAPGEAPRGLGATGDPACNRIWTWLGNPCIALPFGHGPHDLPLAVQLVGRIGGDDDLIAAAAWVEAELAG